MQTSSGAGRADRPRLLALERASPRRRTHLVVGVRNNRGTLLKRHHVSLEYERRAANTSFSDLPAGINDARALSLWRLDLGRGSFASAGPVSVLKSSRTAKVMSEPVLTRIAKSTVAPSLRIYSRAISHKAAPTGAAHRSSSSLPDKEHEGVRFRSQNR